MSGGSAESQLISAYSYAYRCFRDGKDLFHRNIRAILNSCFPDASFDDQMRWSWVTDSVKCSAPIECGAVPGHVARACGSRYLEQELSLFPHALVVALGRKATQRLKGWPGVLNVAAAAPPFGTTRAAKETWKAIPERLGAMRAA